MVRVDVKEDAATRAAATDSAQTVGFGRIARMFLAPAFPPDRANFQHSEVLSQDAMAPMPGNDLLVSQGHNGIDPGSSLRWDVSGRHRDSGHR